MGTRSGLLAVLAALVALVAAGCGTPGAALIAAQQAPRAEVLSWFPDDAVAVALVRTDPDDEEVRALLAAVERSPLGARLDQALADLRFAPAQHRALLGHEMAIGIPRADDPPLAVLATDDADRLAALARARVLAGEARPAGRFRGADLYASGRYAYAVLHDVVAVGRDTAALRDALDVRASPRGMQVSDLRRALPRRHGGKPLIRASADLRTLLAAAGPRVRAVPWIGAAERAGIVVRAGPDGAVADLRIATTGSELVELDVPVSPGTRAPRVADVLAPRISVADLAHVIGVAERGLLRAAPLAAKRLERARRTLRHQTGIDLGAHLVSRLHGPATLVRRGDAWMLRAEPSRPRELARGLRAIRRKLPEALARAGVPAAVRTRGGFLEIGRVRLGLVGDRLVAGTASRHRLVALARAPLARPAGAPGTVAIARPAAPPLPWSLTGGLQATPEELTGRLRLSWAR